MVDPRDLIKPGAVLLGVAAAAALGFAAGFAVARDPKLLRRLAGAVAGGVERVTVAVAESREEIADLWAEVREDARHAAEEGAFAGVAAAAGASAGEETSAGPGNGTTTKASMGAAATTRAARAAVVPDEADGAGSPARPQGRRRASRGRTVAAKPATH